MLCFASPSNLRHWDIDCIHESHRMKVANNHIILDFLVNRDHPVRTKRRAATTKHYFANSKRFVDYKNLITNSFHLVTKPTTTSLVMMRLRNSIRFDNPRGQGDSKQKEVHVCTWLHSLSDHLYRQFRNPLYRQSVLRDHPVRTKRRAATTKHYFANSKRFVDYKKAYGIW